ncbi:MAG: diguanylate cyclase [Ruthenibacterium sp.]
MKCKQVTVRIACALAAALLAVTTICDFTIQLQNALKRETYRTLSEVSSDYNKAFLDRIDYNVKMLKVLAGSLEEMQGQTKSDIAHVLQSAVADGGFAKVVACNAAGRTCASDGTTGDLSQQAFFKKAMRGEMKSGEPMTAEINGEAYVVIAVPIDQGQQGNGALFGMYPVATAGAQLLNFSYYSEGYGFIVTADGTIVLSGEHTDKLADEKNLFDFFEKTDIKDLSTAELVAAVQSGESGSFSFTYQGERRFVSFTPSTINDWYTFSISSDALMQRQGKITKQIVGILVFRLAVTGSLILAWILLWNKRHNKEIRRANQRYQSLLDNINGGVLVAMNAQRPDEIIATYASSGFTKLTGYTLEDIQRLYHGRYLDLVLEEDRKPAFENHLRQIKQDETYRISYRLRKKDGGILWVIDNGYLVKDTDGLHNHSVITDITQLKQQEEELRLSENRFSVAINASSGTLFEVDMKQQLYTHFENAERIFGVCAEKLLADTAAFAALPRSEFAGTVTNYFFHPDDRAIALGAMQQLKQGGSTSYEARLRRYDNSYIWSRIDLTLSLDTAGNPAFLVGFMSDIDSIKKQSVLLESQVQIDPMTGVYNKIAMATLANKVLQEYPNGHHALMLLDIDDFKGINDTLGHAFGDLVLVEICTKLKNALRSSDIVGRMGGDEFAVLMKNIPDTSSVLKKAMELSAAFRQSYAGEKGDYKISCSIGILIIEATGESFETFYRKADAALYQAKRKGKDRFVLYREADAASYPIETTRTNDEELQHLQVARSVEAQIFELLYTSKDFNISINMALAIIGRQYHVSRVSVFENDDTNSVTNNIYEWCNEDVPSEIDKIQNMKISFEGESVLDCFDKDGLLYCNDVNDLPPYPRRLLKEQGVLSTLKVTIVNEDKLYGFIGFDACTERRIWTSEEIEKLSFMAKMLSVFLFKQTAEVAVLENLHTRLKILDVLPNYICVVNPETHSLVYANSKMQELLPAAQAGAFCFQTLRGGQNAPCRTCLVERIKRGDTKNLEIISEDKNLRLKVNALSIHWSNDKTMVLLYGTEKGTEIL